jgi:hypothetical protein
MREYQTKQQSVDILRSGVVSHLIATLVRNNARVRAEDRALRKRGIDPKDVPSEADIIASGYMQRRMKDDVLCAQRLAREGTIFYSSEQTYALAEAA